MYPELTLGLSLISEDRLEVIAHSVRETAHLPGAMAEFGVYRGGSARMIALLCPHKTLHLFDSFAGQPTDDVLPDGSLGHHPAGDFVVTLEEVQRNLAGVKNLAWHVGFFPDTTSELAGDITFSFAHLDSDLFTSIRDGLDYFWPRLVPGGVIVVDDYGWDHTTGVKIAVDAKFSPEQIERTGEYQIRARKPL